MKITQFLRGLFGQPSVTEIKPFHGMYREQELEQYDNKYCTSCKHKGLIAHVASKPPVALAHVLPPATGYIDSYWCPNCENPLLPSETYEETV
jgi:hypothetical protein